MATQAVELGLPASGKPCLGAAFRRENYATRAGSLAYVNGFHLDQDSADVAPRRIVGVSRVHAQRCHRAGPHKLGVYAMRRAT